jgi:hypothetical protein
MDVKPKSVRDFNTSMQQILKRTAFADKCSGWYKNGDPNGPVTGQYGGSFLHFKTCLERIGAEHFEFEWNSPNCFRCLGNGTAIGEDGGRGDMIPYMDEVEATRLRLLKEL